MHQDGLTRVLDPIESARGLPNAHYISDEMFELERQKLLFNNWSGLGFAKNVPNAGDAMPIDFLGMPLLVVRGRDNQVRVFQNTCRHRGMILVSEPKNISGVIRCPYHSWCYKLSGELVNTPHVGGPGHNTHAAIRRNELALFEIRSHVWRDVIFVNVSGAAPQFTDYAADIIARWREFEGQTLYHGGPESSFQFDVACNWKLAVENFCESYHLPWIHPGLNSYSRLEDHYHIEKAGKYSGQGTVVYRAPATGDGRSFPNFANLSDKWDTGAEYIAMYPNVLLATHRDHAYALILEPRAKDRTIEHVELYYTSQDATGPDWEALRKTNAQLWHSVLEEDLFVVEGMQKGRHGLRFDGGKFSPVMDSPTHCFHRWVACQLTDRPVAGA